MLKGHIQHGGRHAQAAVSSLTNLGFSFLRPKLAEMTVLILLRRSLA